MKKIEAIVRASKFEEVKNALRDNEINFFTFYEVKGYGHEKGDHISYRGAVYDVGYIARIKLEIIVSETFEETAIKVITEAAKSGEKGDGLILVSELSNLINIRTGSSGSEAINN